jgi:hypothetical protein
MKSRRVGMCLALLGAGLLWACSIADKDRCASGFIYIPELKACQMVPDASMPAADVAVPPASADSSGSEAVSGPSFGSTCATPADCQSATTDYCVLTPGAPSGYCSKSNCAANCPSGYKCCNCPAFGMVACVTTGDATPLAGLGCTCS